MKRCNVLLDGEPPAPGETARSIEMCWLRARCRDGLTYQLAGRPLYPHADLRVILCGGADGWREGDLDLVRRHKGRRNASSHAGIDLWKASSRRRSEGLHNWIFSAAGNLDESVHPPHQRSVTDMFIWHSHGTGGGGIWAANEPLNPAPVRLPGPNVNKIFIWGCKTGRNR